MDDLLGTKDIALVITLYGGVRIVIIPNVILVGIFNFVSSPTTPDLPQLLWFQIHSKHMTNMQNIFLWKCTDIYFWA